MDEKELKKQAREVRESILRMHHTSNSPHIGSALSTVEILTAMYFNILKIDPKNPKDENRDRFILSKGHAGSALYAVLAQKGFFPKDLLKGFSVDNGKMWEHPNLGQQPGIEATTGSLGHGMPIATGFALAGKADEKNYRSFVLMSDGECDEGSVWEAALFAAQHKLDNLIVIIDYNKIQGFGRVEDVLKLEPFAEKWKAFGFSVKEINGHDFGEIIGALDRVPLENGKPSVIIAHTIKGKGVSFMENTLKWHYKSPNAEQLKKALEEVEMQ